MPIFKAEKPAGFPQADLYQALAYAIAYRLDETHLVYAKGNETARTWTVRGSRVRITAHTLDLNQPPELIREQMDQLAAVIASRSINTPLTWSREESAVNESRYRRAACTLNLAGPFKNDLELDLYAIGTLTWTFSDSSTQFATAQYAPFRADSAPSGGRRHLVKSSFAGCVLGRYKGQAGC